MIKLNYLNNWLIGLCGGLFQLLLIISPVQAQAPTSKPTLTPAASQQILQKERLKKQIESTRQALLGQVEEYQQKYKNYQIAKEQHQSLQTLTALEQAVKATNQVMQARAQVIETYLLLLKLNLLDSQGIELTQKNQALAQIETNLEALTSHQQQIQQAKTRGEVQQLATDFSPLVEAIQQTSYYTLSLLQIGKLQAVFDQARLFHQDLKTKFTKDQQADFSLLQKSEYDRSLSEVQTLLQSIQPELSSLWQETAQVSQTSLKKYQSHYSGLFRDLNPVYADLSQLVSYLDELLTYSVQD